MLKNRSFLSTTTTTIHLAVDHHGVLPLLALKFSVEYFFLKNKHSVTARSSSRQAVYASRTLTNLEDWYTKRVLRGSNVEACNRIDKRYLLITSLTHRTDGVIVFQLPHFSSLFLLSLVLHAAFAKLVLVSPRSGTPHSNNFILVLRC